MAASLALADRHAGRMQSTAIDCNRNGATESRTPQVAGDCEGRPSRALRSLRFPLALALRTPCGGAVTGTTGDNWDGGKRANLDFFVLFVSFRDG